MIQITLAQVKSDIAGKMRGTSIREIKDFYGTAASASRRMMGRIDPMETIRTATLTTPFYDNVVDYALMTDYKRMIDLRPQAPSVRLNMPGESVFSETTPRQFLTRLDSNSMSLRWNNGIRTLRAQQLPIGNVAQMDTFDVTISGLNAVSSGTWVPETDVSGLYVENLNYVEGSGALGMNLSGATGAGDIVNTTAPVTDMSQLKFNDVSFLFFWIPVGYSSRFTSFNLRRGSSASNYRQAIATTKADGTAFTDGWNFLQFPWNNATIVGSPDDTKNTYRRFGVSYTVGVAIPTCLIDNWTDSLGQLYEAEYYSECMFRTATGVWEYIPIADTDLVCVGTLGYEIFLAEMMIDITKQIRLGAVMTSELADWREMLNGQPPNRYVREPQYRGLYSDYQNKFPSSAIPVVTQTYDFDC